MLDGKCKKAAIKYIYDKYGQFEGTYFEGKLKLGLITAIWGYLLEFFDSIGVEVCIHGDYGYGLEAQGFYVRIDGLQQGYEESRKEIQAEGIKKANSCFNNRIKKPL